MLHLLDILQSPCSLSSGPHLPTCRAQPLCTSFLHELHVCFVSGLSPSSRQDYCPEAFGSVWRGFHVFTPQPRPLSPALCAVHRKEEKGEGRQSGIGGGEAATCGLSSGNLSARSLPVRGKAEILSQSQGRVAFRRRSSHLLCHSPEVAGPVGNTLAFMALLCYLMRPFSLSLLVKTRLETIYGPA